MNPSEIVDLLPTKITKRLPNFLLFYKGRRYYIIKCQIDGVRIEGGDFYIDRKFPLFTDLTSKNGISGEFYSDEVQGELTVREYGRTKSPEETISFIGRIGINYFQGTESDGNEFITLKPFLTDEFDKEFKKAKPIFNLTKACRD